MSKAFPIAQLVSQLADALREYDRLAFDEEYEHPLGSPCSPQQIAKLEKRFGRPLPPSYRAFLELHNGWGEVSGDAKFLAVEDHGKEWVSEHLDDLSEIFDEMDQDNPFSGGALVVFLGEESDQLLYIDPHTQRPDGEMDFVALDITTEEQRFPDFAAFLQHKIDLLHAMIDDEKNGVSADEEDDE